MIDKVKNKAYAETAKRTQHRKVLNMPRSVGTIDGTPDYFRVSIRWVDANGGVASDAYRVTATNGTNANIEAAIVALAAASNANIYEVEVSSVYSGNPNPSSATDAPRESVNDVISTLNKDIASGKTQEGNIRAPLDALFLTDSNNIDTANTLYDAAKDAVHAMLPTGYQGVSVRFTEHRKTNPKQRI